MIATGTASSSPDIVQPVRKSALPRLDPPRPMRADELSDVRELWWSIAATGHPLRAEVGVILLRGGRR